MYETVVGAVDEAERTVPAFEKRDLLPKLSYRSYRLATSEVGELLKVPALYLLPSAFDAFFAAIVLGVTKLIVL